MLSSLFKDVGIDYCNRSVNMNPDAITKTTRAQSL